MLVSFCSGRNSSLPLSKSFFKSRRTNAGGFGIESLMSCTMFKHSDPMALYSNSSSFGCCAATNPFLRLSKGIVSYNRRAWIPTCPASCSISGGIVDLSISSMAHCIMASLSRAWKPRFQRAKRRRAIAVGGWVNHVEIEAYKARYGKPRIWQHQFSLEIDVIREMYFAKWKMPVNSE